MRDGVVSQGCHYLIHPQGELVPGDLFAKGLGAPHETATRVVIHFTSVPQAVRTFLDAAELRYEYQVINRSLHV